MLKMIIADDERVIRETLSTLTEWERIGIDMIGLCKDGIETYNMILDESPDIVMTDIRMPGISGLELIKKVGETNLSTQFIVLSGYEEFEYAREAMKYGVKYYLLKPCKETQLIETVTSVRDTCLMNRRKLSEAVQYDAVPKVFAQDQVKDRQQGRGCGAIAGQVMEYVREHISEQNLTLKRIAEHHLYLNVDYVSRQFQKDTGKKFSRFLAEERVRKAKELLINSDTRKVMYVAEQVGCGANSQYFSQIFKKVTGTTPSKWADKMQE